jgi:hypothetical protein
MSGFRDAIVHDHKGYSEEKCLRCGWVMGHRALNCMNDDTPHVFPSQRAEIERLRAAGDALAASLVRSEEQFYAHMFHDGVVTDEVREYVSNHHSLAAWKEISRER